MLDDLKYIHQRDAQDALGVAEKQGQQLEHRFELPEFRIQNSEFSNVVYAGMGGSALAAFLSQTWPGHSLPFEIVREYHIPKYVSEKTLFIASSYSGNTEETLSALAEAEKTGATIVLITSGGQMTDIAQQKGYAVAQLPANLQPRHTAFYQLTALTQIMVAAGLLDKDQTETELVKASDFLKTAVKAWLPTVPAPKNPAKELAMELAGKSIAVYGGPLMAPAAYKWKANFNEDAKNVAWWNQLPEFDHNELIGWSSQPHDKPYAIINLTSSYEHPRVLKRFEVAEKVLSGRRPAAHEVQAQGSSILEHLIWSVAYGNFVSTYLALVNNVNPTPVDLVEKFKKALDE